MKHSTQAILAIALTWSIIIGGYFAGKIRSKMQYMRRKQNEANDGDGNPHIRG